MEKCNVEIIAEKVNVGLISAETGARKLMEIVFRYRYLFNLHQMDEDSFMDFLVYLLPRFEKILCIYDSSKGTFFTFLRSSIESCALTWKKRIVRNNLMDTVNSTSSELVNEEQDSRYILPEDELIEKEALECHAPEYNAESLQCKSYVKRLKIINLRKAAILILALKSSYFLDEGMIEKISRETDVSEEKIKSMVEELLPTLKSKIARREAVIRCRDNAYYFHRKYRLESDYLGKGSMWAQIIDRKYNRQTQTWIDKTRRLSRKQFTVSASNCAVGKALGMDPRHIHYVLKKVEGNMDIICPKEYHE